MAPLIALDGDSSGSHPAPTETFTLTSAVPRGSLLTVVVADGYGYGNQVTSVTDGRGSSYRVDSAVGNAAGDGDIAVAHCVVATPLQAGDSLTVNWSGSTYWPFHITVIAFTEANVKDVIGTPVGAFGAGTTAATVTPTVGDLVIAYATFQGGVTPEPGGGWTAIPEVTGTGPDNLLAVAWQVVTSADPVTFTVDHTDSSGFGAMIVCAFARGQPTVPALVPVTPVEGWLSGSDPSSGLPVPVGYYRHAGSVYLDGMVQAQPDATQAILTGLPAPATTISRTVPLWRGNQPSIVDPALRLPLEWAVTIHPDGSLTLDEPVPAHVLAPPPVTDYYVRVFYNFTNPPPVIYFRNDPRYPNRFEMWLALGNLSYPLAPTADTYTPTSLAPYLGQVTDIDSGIDPHGSRNHLAGEVTAAVDALTDLCFSLPLIGSAANDEADAVTTVFATGKLVPALVGTDVAFGWPEGLVTASPDRSPPLARTCPYPYQQFDPDVAFGGADASNLITHILTSDGEGFGNGLVPGSQRGTQYGGPDTIIYGTFACDDGDGGSVTCASAGSIPNNDFDFDALLAQFQPTPDWFVLRLNWEFKFDNAHDGCDLSGGCGPLLIADMAYEIVSDGSAQMILVNYQGGTPGPLVPITIPSGNPTLFSSSDALYDGAIIPIAPRYIGDGLIAPGIDRRYLWQRGQITGPITISLPLVRIHAVQTISSQLALQPFYEHDTDFIRAGDVIDLTNTGWPGVRPILDLTPGTLLPGPGSAGRVPWLRSAGRFGGADAALGPPGSANAAPQRGGDGGSAGVLRIP